MSFVMASLSSIFVCRKNINLHSFLQRVPVLCNTLGKRIVSHNVFAGKQCPTLPWPPCSPDFNVN
jgi:hypothetical protein